MIPSDLYVEIFTHIKDPTTIRNYVRCNKQLALIGRNNKENKIQQLLIPQVINVNGYVGLIEKYYILPNKSKHGLYQKSYTSDLYSECTYNYGKLCGLYRKIGWNNQVEEQCNYINGKKEGIEQIWHTSYLNKLLQVAFYTNGMLDGKLKRWNEHDGLMDEINYTHGIRHGLYRRWSRGYGTIKSVLIEKANYVNGKRLDFEVRDGNGNIYLQIKYTGAVDYKYLAWHRKILHYGTNNSQIDDVMLMYRRKYKNNVLHGSWKSWHPNGQLKKRVKYVHGLKQGLSENWTLHGVKIQQINYIDDVKQGWTYKWNTQGALISEQLFVNDRWQK